MEVEWVHKRLQLWHILQDEQTHTDAKNTKNDYFVNRCRIISLHKGGCYHAGNLLKGQAKGFKLLGRSTHEIARQRNANANQRPFEGSSGIAAPNRGPNWFKHST